MPCRGRKAFQDICKGLYALHQNGICHMDMKTPNCLLFDDGLCKISDLGQGKILKGDIASMTAESQGTLAWMAPEQFLGRVGFGSDIWALSTILFEVFSSFCPSLFSWPTKNKSCVNHPSAAEIAVSAGSAHQTFIDFDCIRLILVLRSSICSSTLPRWALTSRHLGQIQCTRDGRNMLDACLTLLKLLWMKLHKFTGSQVRVPMIQECLIFKTLKH